MSGIADMRHDLAKYLPEMSRREKLGTFIRFYWRPTRRWVSKWVEWRDLRRYGPIPSTAKERLAEHFGFGDRSPCSDGPLCAQHGWELSPLIETREQRDPGSIDIGEKGGRT